LTLTVADTAFAIAAVRAEERELFEDPHAAAFVKAGAHAAEGVRRFLDLPFFRDGIRLRTRFIDDVVREGLAAGIWQVVLLGAGFDSRADRLAREAVVYEIDSPEQLENKRAILAAAGLTSRAVFVPVDFAVPDFLAALVARGFDRSKPTVFVWEGVIGYIDRTMIDASLEFMARAGGPGSRLVFTFGPATFDPETPEHAVLRFGFARFEELGLDDIWRKYLPGEPHENAGVSRIGVAVAR
jgi:methyltransferase (TIGR00027 family)